MCWALRNRSSTTFEQAGAQETHFGSLSNRFLRNFWLFKTKAPRLWSTEAAWEPFGHQTVEELKMSLQRPSGSHLATRAQNSSKWASRDHLGATWPTELRIAQKELTEAISEAFGHLSPEQRKISLQRPSGSHLATRTQNTAASGKNPEALDLNTQIPLCFCTIRGKPVSRQWQKPWSSRSKHTNPTVFLHNSRKSMGALDLNAQIPLYFGTVRGKVWGRRV